MAGYSALVGFVLTLPACAPAMDRPTAPRTVTEAEDFELAPGQSVLLRPGDLKVTFEKVSGDSRCPVDVVCVWAGDGVVSVSLSQPSQEKATHDLHTSVGPATPGQIVYGGRTVKLVKLAPQPHSTTPIAPGSYRATLRVTRTSP